MNNKENNISSRHSSFQKFICSLRQLMFPREFRIAAPVLPTDYIGSVASFIRQIEEELANKAEVEDKQSAPSSDKSGLLADIATGLWRTRKNLVQEGTDTPKEEMGKVFRHVQSVFDVLETAGVQIKDHTGEKWVDGRSINVVAFQPMPELSEEIIIETIKPSIFFKEQHIQKAQVIVGTPPEQSDDG